MDSNRERDDRTPHAEQYHLPIRTRFPIMHPSEWPSSRLYSSSSPTVSLMRLRGLDGGALGTLGCAGLESVAELAVDGLEVSHAAGTGGLPSLGLLAPVDCPMLIFALGARVSGTRTLAGLSSRVAA
jgi:hypothetical protein